MSVSVLKRVARVPDEYQEVEYIESTGTQWIDTGYKPNGNTKIEIKYQTPTQSTTQQGIFGARNGSLVNAFLVFTGSKQNALQADYYNSSFGGGGSYQKDISGFDGRAINTIEMSNYLKLNGNLIYTLSPTAFQTDSNLYLFAVAINSSGGLYRTLMTGSLWYCKLWDNGILVRNFVPCYRKSDSVVGLYDLVNSVFYTNAGTGTFLKGGDIAPYTAERQSINVLEMTLPKEYQQVEYIQSSGTQWIDPQYTFTSNNYDIIAVAETSIQRREMCLYGVSVGPTGYLEVGWSSTLNRIFAYQQTGGSLRYYDFNNTYNSKIIFHTWQNSNNRYFQANNEAILSDTNVNTSILGNNVILFTHQNSYAFIGKTYSCKIYDNSVLVRDLIPCYRKSDGEIGMFDLVSGTFFTNSGTGTFAKGDNVALPIKRVRACLLEPVLPSEYQQVEYIEGSGTQRIDTAILYDDTKEYKIQVTRAYNRASNSWGASGWNAGGMYGILHSNFGDGTEGNQIAIDFNTYYDIQQIIEKGLGNTITRISQNGTTLATFTRTHTNVKLRAGNLGYPIFCVASTAFANSYDYFEYSRIKSYKIYQDDVLVRNLIPCYRKSDSVVGLYDLVTKTFYTNSGTGTFSKGADATKYNIIRL